MKNKETEYFCSMLAGAISGTTVDMVLYPLDTIKTRMQSAQGFKQSGKFFKVYSGIGTAFLGSAPSAALFFVTYEYSKDRLSNQFINYQHISHMLSAAISESVSCIVRVPVEVIKQRRQAFSHISNSFIVKDIFAMEGLKGYYRGFFVTIMREIPFAFIQYPLWEMFKKKVKITHIPIIDSYMQGALAGGIAAALTTPLDVIKTRVMLSKTKLNKDPAKISLIINQIYDRKRVYGFFAGVVPRVLWMSIGGAIFLGTYDITSKYISSHIDKRSK